jgi:hypothetical protein
VARELAAQLAGQLEQLGDRLVVGDRIHGPGMPPQRR